MFENVNHEIRWRDSFSLDNAVWAPFAIVGIKENLTGIRELKANKKWHKAATQGVRVSYDYYNDGIDTPFELTMPPGA